MIECQILSVFLFIIGLIGVMINRNNLIVVLMSMEIMLLGLNTNFISHSHELQNLTGQVLVFFILTVAAAEAAIGLALLVLFFRRKNDIAVSKMGILKG